jgi:hypothetical protein
VQVAGQQALTQLDCDLQALAAGPAPDIEPIEAATAARPLVIGADGVMVPFRPKPGTPNGPTRWREVKVAILARLKQATNRQGENVTRLERRRLGAVLGDIDALSSITGSSDPAIVGKVIRFVLRQIIVDPGN